MTPVDAVAPLTLARGVSQRAGHFGRTRWLARPLPACMDGNCPESERNASPPICCSGTQLALKMVLTALVVVVTSLAVERSGPFIGALIAALPTAAGAAYTILAIEHPPNFIAASAIGSAATGAAVSIFAAALCGAGAAPRPRRQSRRGALGVVRGRGRCCGWSTGRRSAPWRSMPWSSRSPFR